MIAMSIMTTAATPKKATSTSAIVGTSTRKSVVGSSFARLLKLLFALCVAISILVVGRNITYARDPWIYMIPNALLFTPFSLVTFLSWRHLIKYDTSKQYEPELIPEMNASEYSFEALRALTENFRTPAVVRGLFANTVALQKWPKPGYLNARIGQYEVMAIANTYHDKSQRNRTQMTIGEGLDELFANPDSRTYVFFPVKSRHEECNSRAIAAHDELVLAMNQMGLDELNLERIRPGFGGSEHRSYYGVQLIVGRGHDDFNSTTGTGWHCEAGNNYFIQMAGRKQWFFIDQKNSAMMRPLRGGVVNFQTGELNMSQYQPYIPTKTVIMEPGDLLYNPDWSWHSIKNFPGLNMGAPIREFNVSLSMRNNLQYSTAILVNMVLHELFGIYYGDIPSRDDWLVKKLLILAHRRGMKIDY